MTKEKLLSLLHEHRGEIISGPDLSKHLGVSRNSVWKAMNSLKKEGHEIKSVKNKGYYLEEHSDGLSLHAIQLALGEEANPYHFQLFDEIPSTNTYLKDHEELPHHTVVLAKVQTNGRGRRGKSFYSTDEGGIYLSLLKTENLENYDLSLATLASALALSEVTDEILNVESRVKWVNDLYIGEKKVAGILTEGTMELETRTLSSLIVGIGININTEQFPKDLTSIATSFFLESKKKNERNLIIAKILIALEKYLKMTKENPGQLISLYKEKMLYLGEEILVHQGHDQFTAHLMDLNSQGHLLIKRNGEIHELSSGEISIKKREGNP